MVPFGKDGNQSPVADGVTYDDIGKTLNPDSGQRQLKNHLCTVGDDVSIDMDDAYAVIGVE